MRLSFSGCGGWRLCLDLFPSASDFFRTRYQICIGGAYLRYSCDFVSCILPGITKSTWFSTWLLKPCLPNDKSTSNWNLFSFLHVMFVYYCVPISRPISLATKFTSAKPTVNLLLSSSVVCTRCSFMLGFQFRVQLLLVLLLSRVLHTSICAPNAPYTPAPKQGSAPSRSFKGGQEWSCAQQVPFTAHINIFAVQVSLGSKKEKTAGRAKLKANPATHSIGLVQAAGGGSALPPAPPLPASQPCAQVCSSTISP